MVVGLGGIKLRNALDANLCQTHNVFIGYRAQQVLGMRSQSHANIFHDRLPGLRLFNVSVNALLDENLLQAGKMPLFLELVELELKLGLEYLHRAVGRAAQHVAYPHEYRLLVYNHAGHGAHRRLAGREGIKSIHHLVRRNTGEQLDHNFDVLCRVVFNFLDLNLALIVGLDYGFYKRSSRCSKGYLPYYQCFFIFYFNLSTNSYPPPALAV